MAEAGREMVHESEHLTVTRSPGGGEVVWAFAGECSAKVPNLKGLLDSIVEKISTEGMPVVIDLRSTRYVSSSFVGFLTALVSRLADRGEILELWGPNPRVMDLLGIVGIAGSLKIRPAGSPGEAATSAGAEGER
jgi:anti-anti-sigma factor